MEDKPQILVTGGAGFLGRALVNYLVNKGQKVRVLDVRPFPLPVDDKLVESVVGDIASLDVAKKALEGVNEVYHLSAAHHGNWEYHKAVTVDGFSQLLKAFSDQGGGRVVAMSSVMVYDPAQIQDGDMIYEDFPQATNFEVIGNYARAKIETEAMAQNYFNHPSVQIKMVRAGVIYGPGMPNPLNGVASSIKGKFWVIFGNGNKLVPLIYITDLIKALELLMKTNNTAKTTFNLVDPHAPTQNHHFKLYRELTSDSRRMIKIPSWVTLALLRSADCILRITGRSSDASLTLRAKRSLCKFVFSSDQMKNELGFEPSVVFREGLIKTLIGEDVVQ